MQKLPSRVTLKANPKEKTTDRSDYGDVRRLDVVTEYMRRQAETYGMGYVPPEYGGMTRSKKIKAITADTRDIARELFGQHWRKWIAHAGLGSRSLAYLTGRQNTRGARIEVHHVRLAQMCLLVHLGEIRERVREQERALWILLQRTHDPHLTGETIGLTANARKEMRQKIRQSLGEVIKDVPKPYYLPLRALAMIEYPHMDSEEARKAILEEMIDSGEVTANWFDPRESESEREPVLQKRHGKVDGVRKAPAQFGAWMAWRASVLARTGERVPKKLADLDAEQLASYQAFKASWVADETRKRKKAPVKRQTVEEYVGATRAAREKERAALRRHMGRHGYDLAEVESRMEEMLKRFEVRQADNKSTDT